MRAYFTDFLLLYLMNTIDTISDLLSLSNSQYRIFDVGRKISKLSKETFSKVEQNQLPYPYPIQGHAMLAVAFWQNKSSMPYLWFVKLPLDERGLIVQASRNHYIAIIIEALGSDLSVDPTEQQEELLKANPYNFTPAGYKLAALNSQLKVELKQAPSIHFEFAQQYISGQHPWTDWPNIGLQGLCDVSCRVNDKNINSEMSKHLHALPEQVLFPLCTALENQALPLNVIAAITSIYDGEDKDKSLHLVRALASTANHQHVAELVDNILVSGSLSEDMIITLAGRCWTVFEQPSRLQKLLELLAKRDDSQLFQAIFKDLVAIPSVRPHVFTVMRAENRSNELAAAIGQLFNA